MTKKCIALVLAGGQGTRLAALTRRIPKPAIPFGGKCRLIDFSLSNCINSEIDVIGVLTTKRSDFHNSLYTDHCAQLFREHSLIYSLPPRNTQPAYRGTANAVYENIDFIDKFSPEHVLILAGDHVYKMDYRPYIKRHLETGADLTISALPVPWSDASRFGVISLNAAGSIGDFAEKPAEPRSNLASMGIYLFSWPKLKHYLRSDDLSRLSNHDFGQNIIPAMLKNGEKLFAYKFNDYWRDVGTIESFYQTHMDLLSEPPKFDIFDNSWPLHSSFHNLTVGGLTALKHIKSIVGTKAFIRGDIEGSVIFPGAYVEHGAKIKNSVIMPGAWVGRDVRLEQAIIGPGAVVERGCHLLGNAKQQIAVVGQNIIVSPNIALAASADCGA